MMDVNAVRVYVSSTFQDLRRERDIVLDAIERNEATAIGMEQYGADGRRPLDRCVADVKSCDLYVGIVGWRYGYRPPETPQLSITESEYRAAGEAGIVRLVYLTPGIEQWDGAVDTDATAIRVFRERVATEVSAYPFADAVAFTAAVGHDLGRHLRGAEAVPVPAPEGSLLPYLCDRVPQKNKLLDLLASTGDEQKPVPVCILHGDHDQSIAKFVDCLRDRRLSKWLDARQYPVRELRIDWVEEEPESAPRRARQSLARELGLDVRSASDEEIRRRLEAHPGPVLVTLQVRAESWNGTGARWVEQFAEYFRAWPPRWPPKPDLVLVWVEYPRLEPGWLGLGSSRASERRRKAVIEAVEGFAAPGIALLPRARSVPQSDVAGWTRRVEVRRLIGERDVDADVDRLYSGRREIPMKELGPRLMELLR